MSWKEEAATAAAAGYYAEALSTYDETYKRSYRSAPHSPRILGSRFPPLHDLRLSMKTPVPVSGDDDESTPFSDERAVCFYVVCWLSEPTLCNDMHRTWD